MNVDEENRIPVHELASWFVDSLPDDFTRDMGGHDFTVGTRFINHERLDDVADAFQMVIASAIAMLIDAGSERDAVMESEDLHLALVTELKGWSDQP